MKYNNLEAIFNFIIESYQHNIFDITIENNCSIHFKIIIKLNSDYSSLFEAYLFPDSRIYLKHIQNFKKNIYLKTIPIYEDSEDSVVEKYISPYNMPYLTDVLKRYDKIKEIKNKIDEI
jgi:hypothetical protein